MPDRRNFLKSTLLPAGALFLPPAISLQAQQKDPGLKTKNYNPLSQRLKEVTAKTTWTAVITQNPSYFELSLQSRIRAHFLPDDNDSTLYIYEDNL